MSYKGLHIITIGSIFCILLSCNREKSITVCYKQSFPIDTIVSVQEYAVEDGSRIPQLFKVKNRLLVFGDYDMMRLYSYPELQLIHDNKEGPGGASKTVNDDKLYVEKQGKVGVYELENDSLVQTSSFVIAGNVPYTIGTVQELRPDVYIYPDMYDFPGIHEFHIVDISKRQCVSKGDYPEDNVRFKKLREFKVNYMHHLQVKPDKSAFVVVYSLLRRIRIYNKDSELCHDIFLENNAGNYKVIPKDSSKQYWHFGKVFVTDKYIYILNPDKLGIAAAKPRCNILVLDWEGNLIARYKFNVWIYDFFVDEANEIIFGSCWGKLKKDAFFSLKTLI